MKIDRAKKLSKGNMMQKSPASRILYVFLSVVVSFVVLTFGFLPEQVDIEEGQAATEDIYYKGASTTVVSDILTEEAKQVAAQEVGQLYQKNATILTGLLADVERYFSAVLVVKADETLATETEKVVALKSQLPANLAESSIVQALKSSEGSLGACKQVLCDAIKEVYDPGVTVEDASAVPGKIDDILVADKSISGNTLAFSRALAGNLDFAANKIYDPVATAAEVEKIMAEIYPVHVSVQQGELLLAKGEVADAKGIELLQLLGLHKGRSIVLTYFGILLFVAMLYALLVVFLAYYKKKLWREPKNILILGILINLVLIIGKLIVFLSDGVAGQVTFLSGILMPVAICSMLATVLLDKESGVFTTVILGLFTGFLFDAQLLYVFAAIFSGFVAIASISGLDQRSKYAVVGLRIALVYMAAVVAWGFAWGYSYATIGIGIGLAFVNGILSVVFTVGLLPFFESAFGITTMLRLLELSNSNNPLIKKMMLEAPGTYQHSVLVGNLAEAAANALGADPLVVRVGAYFHDIGKIKRPYFFIENQNAGENPHGKLQPTLSTLIIVSHVKEGIEIAKEYKLPQVIIDMVEQHHGTSLVSFFYNKAKKQDGEDKVNIEEFCYPGPKPQSKEAAIILLADSVQAAVQAMSQPTKGQIEGRIRSIIKNKLDSGQLEECDLTFKDLNVIADSFTQVLASVSHKRVDYPPVVAEMMKKGEEAAEADGTIDKQSAEEAFYQPGVENAVEPGLPIDSDNRETKENA